MAKPYQRRLFAEEQAAASASDSQQRVNVKLWLLDDSRDKSAVMLVEPEPYARRVIVARSLMGDRISKRKDPGCLFTRWEFTLPLWKAEELRIEYE